MERRSQNFASDITGVKNTTVVDTNVSGAKRRATYSRLEETGSSRNECLSKLNFEELNQNWLNIRKLTHRKHKCLDWLLTYLSSEISWKILNVGIYLLSCSYIHSSHDYYWVPALCQAFWEAEAPESCLWRVVQEERASGPQEQWGSRRRYNSWHLWFRHLVPGQRSHRVDHSSVCSMWLQVWCMLEGGRKKWQRSWSCGLESRLCI